MKEEKKKVNEGGREIWIMKYLIFGKYFTIRKEPTEIKVAKNLFRIEIDYNYQQIISESIQTPPTQMASEKVANTVATFFNRDSKSGTRKGDQYGGNLFDR